ncbi:hypothetical protein U1Q18_046234 [Sarracenia purpurea var. burkii]
MKGLFKSKPRTPAELVRQVRDLLIYADRNTEPRETKRQEKVLIPRLLSMDCSPRFVVASNAQHGIFNYFFVLFLETSGCLVAVKGGKRDSKFVSSSDVYAVPKVMT